MLSQATRWRKILQEESMRDPCMDLSRIRTSMKRHRCSMPVSWACLESDAASISSTKPAMCANRAWMPCFFGAFWKGQTAQVACGACPFYLGSIALYYQYYLEAVVTKCVESSDWESLVNQDLGNVNEEPHCCWFKQAWAVSLPSAACLCTIYVAICSHCTATWRWGRRREKYTLYQMPHLADQEQFLAAIIDCKIRYMKDFSLWLTVFRFDLAWRCCWRHVIWILHPTIWDLTFKSNDVTSRLCHRQFVSWPFFVCCLLTCCMGSVEAYRQWWQHQMHLLPCPMTFSAPCLPRWACKIRPHL